MTASLDIISLSNLSEALICLCLLAGIEFREVNSSFKDMRKAVLFGYGRYEAV